MKKQIKEKGLLLIIIIIFLAAIAVVYSSCKKQAGAIEKIATLAGPTIIYTDVNPDSAISGNSTYSFDLNNDRTFDFTFNAFSQLINCNTRNQVGGGEYGTNVTMPGGSNNGIIFVLNPNYAACLDSLTIINNSSKWSYISSQALVMYLLSTCVSGPHTSYGHWYILGSNQDRYMRLKLIKGSKIYYGWVRLYLNTSLRKLIVKDYAYNSRPGQAIRAGQRY